MKKKCIIRTYIKIGTNVPIAKIFIIRENSPEYIRLSLYLNGGTILARKFQFYNVVITLNNTATRLYFSEFLDKVQGVDWNKRVRKINNHPTALFETVVPNMDQTCRVGAVGKYRQTVKPYIGDLNESVVQMIEDDIIEMTTFVVSPQVQTVLVESNLYGSKAKDIEEYFNSFLANNDPRKQWAVHFMPVDSNRSLADIRASSDIKDVQLKFNVDSKDYDLLQQRIGNKKSKKTLLENLLNVGKEIRESIEAPIVDLKFGKGRKRKLELDNAEIVNVISQLNIDENESVLSCTVNFKNSSGRYEKLDLKNVGIKSDFVLRDDKGTHGWEFIGDKILEKYIETGRLGGIAQRNLKFHDENVDMPKLSSNVPEKYFVKMETGEREEEGDSA